MRVTLHKISDERHGFTVAREGMADERVELETRSTLAHDFLHFAVESEARIAHGFFGRLARGVPLAELNDRAQTMPPDLAEVERAVGALAGATKGRSPDELWAGMSRYAASLGEPLPSWLTRELIAAASERVRRLLGQWNATPFGGAMVLAWPASR